MKKWMLAIFVMTLPLWLANCSSGGGGGGGSDDGGGGGTVISASAFQDKLIGNWGRFDCQFDSVGGRDFQYGETFTATQMVATWFYYRTSPGVARCSQVDFSYELTFNYLVSATAASGIFNIDMQATKLRVKPYGNAVASAFNSADYLGYHAWTNGVGVSFTGPFAGAQDFPDDYQYSILKMVGHQLFWGDWHTGAGTTPYNRPTVIDPNNYENRY